MTCTSAADLAITAATAIKPQQRAERNTDESEAKAISPEFPHKASLQDLILLQSVNRVNYYDSFMFRYQRETKLRDGEYDDSDDDKRTLHTINSESCQNNTDK